MSDQNIEDHAAHCRMAREIITIAHPLRRFSKAGILDKNDVLFLPLNPLITAVPFWGQTTRKLTGLSPKRDCGSKTLGLPFNFLRTYVAGFVALPFRGVGVWVLRSRIFDSCSSSWNIGVSMNSPSSGINGSSEWASVMILP